MMKRGTSLLATVGAVALLGLLAGGAASRMFSTSGQTLRANFAGAERVEITGLFGTYRCALTLEGSLHARTIAKVASSLIGSIDRAEMAECSAMGLFENRVLRETLPWHVRYRAFTGVLPNIASLSISIVGFAMQIREGAAGIRCLGTSTAEEPFVLTYPREGGGRLGSPTASGAMRTRCPEGLEVGITFGGTTRSIAAPVVTLI